MSTMILPNDLKRQYSLHADEYKQKAIEVLDSGWYILGKELEAFKPNASGPHISAQNTA